MSEQKRGVSIVWNPDVVGYSSWPDLTPGKSTVDLEADRHTINKPAYEPNLILIEDAEPALSAEKHIPDQVSYDRVLIGAGAGSVPEHFIVHEQLVNAVHEPAPNAKICFNANPGGTAVAVQRWARA